MEENNVVDNTTVEVPETVEKTEEEKAEELANDSLAMAYDYYDHYYDEVTKSLSRIEVNTSTMIEKQNEIKDKLHAINTTCSCFTFIVTLIFIYTVIRNMIIIK